MARPLRIEYENAWYHIMNRGAGRRKIFYTPDHRKLFFELLNQLHLKYKVEIHAYCLMSNHYHLLLKTHLANLSRAMQCLNGHYTQLLNRSMHTDGALFRGRYKSIIVSDEDYLLRLSRYIHLNPVEANICDNPEDYQWSSYLYYIGNNEKPEWLFRDEILQRFGDSNNYDNYKLFVNEGIDQETKNFYQQLKQIPILGTKEFTKSLTEKYLRGRPINREIPGHKIVIASNTPTISTIIDTVAKYYNVSTITLKKSKSGITNKPRSIAIFLAVELCQKTLIDVANEFDRTCYTTISKIYYKVSKMIFDDTKLRNDICRLRESFIQQLHA